MNNMFSMHREKEREKGGGGEGDSIKRNEKRICWNNKGEI